MNVLTHLEQEHRKVEAMLKTLGDSEPGPARERTLAELESALATHMAVEERFIYPLVKKDVDDEMAEEADIEHNLARTGLRKLRELVGQPGFGAAVDMVKGGIGHHVKEEEGEMFPALRKEAAEQIDAMDPEELEEQVKSSPAGDATKAELYERARKAGIEGRSSMTKDELVHALGGSR
jgi:iron-sulfur cluster repair protein YtfE (RIC family)